MTLKNFTLSEQLKLDTKSNHQQVEKLLIAQMRSIDTTESYVKLLRLFYGYFGALEDKINQYIGLAQLSDYQQRRKSDSLFNDIEDLGGFTLQKAEDTDLPEIKNHLQAFGALYVIEGSTLGGKIISKIMSKQLNLADEKGLSFFISYGDETEKMWEDFKVVLDLQPEHQGDAALIINAADETFAKFKLWIEKF